jgi:hypothetical protein
VVTLTLYVEPYESPGPAVSVSASLLADSDALPNEMQVAKASVETWTLPVHAPELLCTVSVDEFMGALKLMVIVEPTAMNPAPSLGTVLVTLGAFAHTPAPSHVVPPTLHTLPAAVKGCVGAPAVQVSPVHWLPSSAGTSVLSAAEMMLPAPSHWFFWQSAGVCALVAVPAGASFAPQAPALHVRVWHSVSAPAHCDARLHCTQARPPSQNDPPPWLHAVSIAALG